MKVKALGVAGFMGSGKSTAAAFLAAKTSRKIIDVDLYAKELMVRSTTILTALDSQFGVVSEGQIDFAKLGSIVFSSKKALLNLNAIVHPLLVPSLNKEIADSDEPLLLDAALIPLWSNLNVDCSIWIDVPQEIRVKRIVKRNSLSRDLAIEKIEGQYRVLQKPDSGSHWILVENSVSINQFEDNLLSVVENNKL